MKTTRIAAGHHEYKGFTIERRECGEWFTGPTGEFAQDVTSTLKEAIALINTITDNNTEESNA